MEIRQVFFYRWPIKEQSNDTIPLLDIIDLSISKAIIALPWKSPLDEDLQFHDHPDDIVLLCLQFLEGVAFLHHHKVVHYDLKPRNIVVDTISELETLLWIIYHQL